MTDDDKNQMSPFKDYLPVFWVNKAVYGEKYIRVMCEALYYSSILLFIETPFSEPPTRAYIGSVSELLKLDKQIRRLIGEVPVNETNNKENETDNVR